MRHEGFSVNRLHPLADNKREVAFAEAWKAENMMGGTLDRLIPECTERDAQVAATVVQWLGSNVGNSFLSKVISENENIRYSLGVVSNLTAGLEPYLIRSLNMKKDENIAMLPDGGKDEHELCSICKDDNVVVVIQGGSVGRGTNCYYCGNTIVLCSKHAGQMVRELAALNLGF